MNLRELESCLDSLGVKLAARGDKLCVDAPAGVLNPQLRAALAEHKPALLLRLASAETDALNALNAQSPPPDRLADHGGCAKGVKSPPPAAEPLSRTAPTVSAPGVVGLVYAEDLDERGEFDIDRFFARLRAKHKYPSTWEELAPKARA
jgi:hypothetical protein